jgi:hypothetical protein
MGPDKGATRLRRILWLLVCPAHSTNSFVLWGDMNIGNPRRFRDSDNPFLASRMYEIGEGKYISALDRINCLLDLSPTVYSTAVSALQGVDF